MTKIAYLTSCYPRASDSFIRSEIAELRKLGFEVLTFSVRQPEKSQRVSLEIQKEFEQTVYLLSRPVRLFFDFFYFCIKHPLKLFKTCSFSLKIRPAGLRGLLWQFAYLIEAASLARQLQKGKVKHLHNHIAEASATVAMFASLLSDISYSFSIHGPGIFYHPKRWALEEKIAKACFVRCISHFCKSQCMAFSKKKDWQKLHVIRSVLNVCFENPGSLPIPQAPRFFSVGRLEPIKGFALLIEAVERLIGEGFSCECVIAGDGPDKKELEQLIISKQLQNSVKLLGWIDAESVKNEMLASRAVVCSSFNEGLPVVLMEALKLGRPVVAPIVSGIPELIKDSQEGFLYFCGSLDGLVEAMKKMILLDEKSLEQMGEKGKKHLSCEFDSGVQIRQLAALIEQSIEVANENRSAKTQRRKEKAKR